MLLFLFSLVFARGYCGWLCPAAGLQECCQLVAKKKIAGEKGGRLKYFIWVPWIIAIIVVAISAGGLREVDIFYQTWHGISVYEPAGYVVYFAVVLLIVTLALTFGKRSFCHHACWMAPFMIIGTMTKDSLKLPSLHLFAQKERCIRCKKCTAACQMSLKVHEMVELGSMKNHECILCGECVDACPKGAIYFRFGKTNKGYVPVQGYEIN